MTKKNKDKQGELRFSGEAFKLADVAESLAKTDLYFGYGSNMNRDQMRGRCPLATFVGPASLTGWKLVSRGVADVERANGGKVGGALWRLTSSCLRSLDRYEGFPSYYSREIVRVLTENGELWAWVYVMTDARKRTEYPFSAGYALACAEGARQCGVPVSALYLRDIATGPTGATVKPWRRKEAEPEEELAPVRAPLPKHAEDALRKWGKDRGIDARKVANMIPFASYDEARGTIRVAGDGAYVTIDAPLAKKKRPRSEVTADELEALERSSERLLLGDESMISRAELATTSERERAMVERCRERVEGGVPLTEDMRAELQDLL